MQPLHVILEHPVFDKNSIALLAKELGLFRPHLRRIGVHFNVAMEAVGGVESGLAYPTVPFRRMEADYVSNNALGALVLGAAGGAVEALQMEEVIPLN